MGARPSGISTDWDSHPAYDKVCSRCYQHRVGRGTGDPQAEPPSAAASKHALLGPTKATASDYPQHGIRINAVSPSGIRRRRSPMVYATSSRTTWCANFWASPPAQSQKR
ncbi:MAG: SDR family oxidoreductase [Mycobacterium sp.]